MRVRGLWKAALTIVVAAGAVTAVGAAGAAGTANSPSRAEIAPLNLRVESEGANRSDSGKHGKKQKHNGVATPVVGPTSVGGTNATVSFDGSNMFDQRTLNGFYLEPPDQGMCVSQAAAPGGRVLEVVNDVESVYDYTGGQLEKQTLNSFFGYPGLRQGGPELTDPSCYYDEETGAWFVAVLTLDLNQGFFNGGNHIDIAVSNPANHDPATTTWKVYTIPAQNNGTQGTPNHNCDPGPPPVPPEPPRLYPDACVADYPHIGADKYGFYVTTNEYPFFSDGFNSAQIYALSKHKLAANEPSVPWVLFSNTKLDKEKNGPVGFTIWPSVVPGTAYNLDNGGTEFFLSSTAGEESGNTTGSSNSIGLWAILNTSSLDGPNPKLQLTSRSLDSEPYGVPPLSDQPGSGTTNGNFPLGQCLNDDDCATALNGEPDPFKPEVIGQLDSNDSRMQQVYYAAGKVWGALDTRISIGGAERAGIAWFIVDPVLIGNGNGRKIGPQSSIANQGYVGVANNNLTYPALAVNTAGAGAMAFTIVGPDLFPGAADILIDQGGTHGSVFVPARGVGLQDGFSEYAYYAPVPPNIRPRWGDYGAADEDGGSIWIASEYIGQQCTLAQYIASAPFGSCGGTRRALGNWDTRISHVNP